jgi:predicted RNase H-like nuclease (RuvC/YqgF family)
VFLRVIAHWNFPFVSIINIIPDLSNRDNEIQKLSTEISHAKDILQRQTIEKEQLNQQLSSLQSNHAEESKIEFKNLQNALDSSKKELEAQRMIVNDYKMKIEDLSKQVGENKQLTQKSGDSFLVSEIN